MLVFEVWEDGDELFVQFVWWAPTKPSWAAKAEKNARHESLLSLYGTGHGVLGPRVSLAELEKRFSEWTDRTGTYEEICGVDMATTLDAAPSDASAWGTVHDFLIQLGFILLISFGSVGTYIFVKSMRGRDESVFGSMLQRSSRSDLA